MSNIKSFANGCLKKKRFIDEKFAMRRAKQITKESGIEFRHYYCDDCLGFHLTKQPKQASVSASPVAVKKAVSAKPEFGPIPVDNVSELEAEIARLKEIKNGLHGKDKDPYRERITACKNYLKYAIALQEKWKVVG